MTKYDLHSHSTASDGALTPTQLVQRAKTNQVTALALTDHDTIGGLAEAQIAADAVGIQLISGIELSTTWKNKCFHIVGLGINTECSQLVSGISNLQQTRRERAKKIATKLEKKGVTGAYESVLSKVGKGMITRSHFADFLVAENHVSSHQKAFDTYLGKGKSAFVGTVWAELEDAINWIQQAGGVAVIAHPLRYKLTASWMRRLLSAFKEMGGAGIEVITGRSNKDEIQLSVNYAKKFDLAASVGSDFHNPANKWVELGRLAPLPEDIQPIWELLNTK